jgi:hypothetical protein
MPAGFADGCFLNASRSIGAAHEVQRSMVALNNAQMMHDIWVECSPFNQIVGL